MYKAKIGNLMMLIISVFGILGAITIGFIGGLFPKLRDLLSSGIGTIFLLGITDFVFLGVPIITYVLIKRKPLKEIFRFNKLRIVDALLVAASAILFLPAISILGTITSIFSNNDVGEMVTSIASMPTLVMLFFIAVLPSIFEELALRGIALSEYRNKSIVTAVVMNGFLFSLFHLNIQQSLYTFAMGSIMALIVIYTDSIFSSMIFHFVVNGINVIMAKIGTFMLEHADPNVVDTANKQVEMNSVTIISYAFFIMLALTFAVGGAFVVILIRERNKEKWVGKYPPFSVEEVKLFNLHLPSGDKAREAEDKNLNESYDKQIRQQIRKRRSAQRIIDITLILNIIVYIFYTLVLTKQIIL